MAESFKELEVNEANADFIISEDLVAEKLLKEIYSNLKHKPTEDLSIAEHCWIRSIEDLYQNKKSTISNKVDWFLQIGHDLLKEEKELNKEEKAMISSFRRVLDVSAKNNSLTNFFTELENSVESLFRLDFSQETKIPAVLESGENDLLNYIVMTVEMIRERLGQSVVSGKVVRNIMGRISDVGILVTDEHGRIRFANDKMSDLVTSSAEDLIGASIKDFVTPENILINGAPKVRVEDLEVQQIKVPALNGEIDEWVYTFSEKVDHSAKIERMSEVRSVIEELSDCDKNDEVKMNVLLEVLKSKFAKIEEVTIPANGLLKSGSNLRTLIDDCLVNVDLKHEGIDIILDAKDSILYFGNDEELRTIVEQMLDCACQNLKASPRDSKLEIVVSSFQYYLLLAFMDNGAIASNYTLINEMRQGVEKIQGTLELNSGRMGNNLSIILPV
ncbi:MAG: PAS domain-containing protein [Crocinitomicaceae bacterium]|nr:PAS domain-containing protein [Crocinitomicaceae bacterium]